MLLVVSDVQWSPTYELHATTENGKPSPSVTLQYRARVRQSTGEDWTNTALTLNTVSSDLLDKQIPQLRPVKLTPAGNPFGVFSGHHHGFPQQTRSRGLFGVQQQQQQALTQQQATMQQRPAQVQAAFGAATSAPGSGGSNPSVPASTLFGSTSIVIEDTFEEVPSPAPIAEPSSFVAETPIAISYSITGESSIPSDGVEHQVSVAVLPFDATVSYITIPRIDPRVYLQVTNFLSLISRMDG